MDTVAQLTREFSAQDFPNGGPDTRMLDRCRDIARNYARMENAVAVLSDLRSNVSYIYYGGFSRTLGIDRQGDGRMNCPACCRPGTPTNRQTDKK